MVCFSPQHISKINRFQSESILQTYKKHKISHTQFLMTWLLSFLLRKFNANSIVKIFFNWSLLLNQKFQIPLLTLNRFTWQTTQIVESYMLKKVLNVWQKCTDTASLNLRKEEGKAPEESLNRKLEYNKIFGDSGDHQFCYHCVIKEWLRTGTKWSSILSTYRKSFEIFGMLLQQPAKWFIITTK